MSALCAFLLLSVVSQTFAQSLFLANTRKNIIQNRGSGPSNSMMSSPDANNTGGRLEETDLNSPILSKFALYNLQVHEEAGVYPRLFDVTFSPDVVRENFYNEAIYFALDNGLYEVGSLPQKIADAAVKAFPNLTPLQYFKVVSNTLELVLQKGGMATEGDYKVLVRLITKANKDAKHSLKEDDARSFLHGITVGTGTVLKTLSLDSPDYIRYLQTTFVDQLSKVPPKGNF